MNKILLDKVQFKFSKDDLPVLIHGKEHFGASLFTMTLLSNLYLRNPKMLMITGYHMARDEFIAQTDDENNTLLADTNHKIEDLEKTKVIFVKREDQQLFIDLSKKLSDINERIILIKNIDFFPEDVFDAVKDKNLLIISGDLDKCPFKEKILSINFNTKVVFSKPEFDIVSQIPELSKYQGYLWQEVKQGIVTLETHGGS